MIVAYPFSVIDQDLALKNAIWINELGGCKGHQVLMCWDKRCSPGVVDAVKAELNKAFDSVLTIEAQAEIDGWPDGANYMFRTVAGFLSYSEGFKEFLWMEPDAIPMTPGWIDKLESEYRRAGRLFMGDRVQVEDIPLHMSGVGIYALPLYLHAGEAYRAHDIAWDMAGKDQIVPKAHFTKLIEHAWKHPKFTSHSELATQIRPECILFHSSKDGSLIDLLRGASQDLGEETTCLASSTPVPTQLKKGPEEPGSPSPSSPVCDIFIRTYPGDYNWLTHCLVSILKYAKGFRKVWIVSPQPTPVAPMIDPRFVEWVHRNDECESGYMAQQITKLYADTLTNQEPDYILHIDSDTLLTRDITPQDFFYAGRPFWFYTAYAAIETPWQPVTSKFMGDHVDNEFMRRFPIMIPKWLYPKLREFCYQKHHMVVSDYIRHQPGKEFSEFNALGAYAYKFHHDKFAWVDTQGDEFPLLPPCARQFFSWGGITLEVETEIKAILSGGGQGPLTAGEKEKRPVSGTTPVQPDTNGDTPSAHLSQISNRHDLGDWLNRAGLKGIGVEIGVQTGHFSEQILSKWQGQLLFLVDPWKEWPRELYHDDTNRPLDWEKWYQETLQRVSRFPGRYGVLRMESDQAAPLFPHESFDFIYVDGNHHNPQIRRDLENWWPLLKPGGLFCGHDYLDASNEAWRCDVKSEVDAFVKRNNLTLHAVEGSGEFNGWYILKPISPEVTKDDGFPRCSPSSPPVTSLTPAKAIEFLQQHAAESQQKRWHILFDLRKAGLVTKKQSRQHDKKANPFAAPRKKVPAKAAAAKVRAAEHPAGLVPTEETTT